MDQTLTTQAIGGAGGLAPVSVVIPCYRCHRTIGTAVQSVVNQTLPPAEIILVDDCSGDDGLTLASLDEISRKYRGSIRIVILPLPENRGAGEARNAGWEVASQELVAFLDADDTWHPRKLVIQAGWMLSHPSYVFTCHDSVVCEGTEQYQLPADSVEQREIAWQRLLYKNDIATRTAMLRRSIDQRFPRAVRFAEDYQLWLRILLGGGKAVRFCLPLAFSFKRDFGVAGLSQNLKAMHLGVLDCLGRLRDDRLISRHAFLMASLFEVMKYWRRIAITTVSRWRCGT